MNLQLLCLRCLGILIFWESKVPTAVGGIGGGSDPRRRSSSPFGWGMLMDWFKGKSAENPHLIGLLSGSIYRKKNDEKKTWFPTTH
jgi:hypothetical protein